MEAKIRARLMARSKDAPKKPGQEPARPRVNSRSKSPGADASPSYMAGTARSEYRKAAFDTESAALIGNYTYLKVKSCGHDVLGCNERQTYIDAIVKNIEQAPFKKYQGKDMKFT